MTGLFDPWNMGPPAVLDASRDAETFYNTLVPKRIAFSA
jgi:hypothetical protein